MTITSFFKAPRKKIEVTHCIFPSVLTLRDLSKSLWQDVQFFHTLRFPGQSPILWSSLYLVLSSPGLLVLAVHRFANYCEQRPPVGYKKLVVRLPTRVLLSIGEWFYRILTKCDILPATLFEGGVYLSDHGHIVLGACSVGRGTVIHERVTIGMNLIDEGKPEIGRNVWIGPDSVIHGKINIGDGATILPHTVLTKSIPAGCVVQGNPARVVARDMDNSALRQNLVCTNTNISKFMRLCGV